MVPLFSIVSNVRLKVTKIFILFSAQKNSNYANIYIAYFYIWRCIWYICYNMFNVNIVIKLTSPLGLSSPWPSFSVNRIIFMLATYRWGPMRKHSVQTLEWSHLSLNLRCRHHRHYRHNHLYCVVLEEIKKIIKIQKYKNKSPSSLSSSALCCFGTGGSGRHNLVNWHSSTLVNL